MSNCAAHHAPNDGLPAHRAPNGESKDGEKALMTLANG